MNIAAIKKAVAEARLTIDIVPENCPVKDIRHHLPPEEWESIASAYIEQSNYLCRICGSTTTRATECREVWEFDDTRRLLTLVGFQAVCAKCSCVRALRRSSTPQEFQLAVYQLAQVNRWSEDLARQCIKTLFRVCETRGEKQWRMNLEFIRRNFSYQLLVKTTAVTRAAERLKSETDARAARRLKPAADRSGTGKK